MPAILSIREAIPSFTIRQDQAVNFSRRLFSETFQDIERLLGGFQNGQIEERHFTKELKWYERDRSFDSYALESPAPPAHPNPQIGIIQR